MDTPDQTESEISQSSHGVIPKTYLLAGAALLGIIVFGSGIFILSNTQKKQLPPIPTIAQTIVSFPSPTMIPPIFVPSVEPSPTIIPTETPVPDPLPGWNAYVSTKGYYMKYPADWTARVTQQSDPKIMEYVVFNPRTANSGELAITLTYSTRTTAELIATTSASEKISVGGIGSTRQTIQNSDGQVSTKVVIPYGANTVQFVGKSTYQSTFTQMLSSFKIRQ